MGIRQLLAMCDRAGKPRPTELRLSLYEWYKILDSMGGGEPIDVAEQTIAGISIMIERSGAEIMGRQA